MMSKEIFTRRHISQPGFESAALGFITLLGCCLAAPNLQLENISFFVPFCPVETKN